MFTLIGAGITPISQAEKPMSDVLPSQCVHMQHKVEEFNPESSQITLSNGQVVITLFISVIITIIIIIIIIIIIAVVAFT